jgi:hypothetical protein
MCETGHDLARQIHALSANATSPAAGSKPALRPLLELEAVDSVDVTILVDNSIDVLLPSQPPAIRPPLAWDSFQREPPFADGASSC